MITLSTYTSYNIIKPKLFNIPKKWYLGHFDTPPQDLQVENPLECPSFAPYVHVNPSAAPHFLQVSLNSILGGAPSVGITLASIHGHIHRKYHI